MNKGEIGPQAEANGNQSRKKLSWLIVAVVVLTGMALAAFWWHEMKTYVSTENAKVAGDIVDISPKISGRCEKVLVKEGDIVKVGQVIAELDNDQYRVAMEQAKASLELARANYQRLPEDLDSLAASVKRSQEELSAAQAQVEAARIALADAERSLQQNQALYEAGAVAKETLQAALSRYATCKTALEAAEAKARAAQAAVEDASAKWEAMKKAGVPAGQAQVKQAEAAYRSARLNYENSIIKSPVNGTVLKVSVQAGETVSPGQTLITVCDLATTWVIANIDENKVGRIKVGEKVEVRFDAYPGRVFSGKVIEVGGATQSTFALIPTENTSGNFTKVTQRVPIKIAVDSQGVVLRPGLSAQVKIHAPK